jgi:L-serine kinase (ADP)
VELIDVRRLRHIEGFSPKRVQIFLRKIEAAGVWTQPLCIERTHCLVMDGQHRMEVALALGLKRVPCELFDYQEVELWSLRPKTCEVTRELVVQKALAGDIYPYKTAKHRFPYKIPAISVPLDDLR